MLVLGIDASLARSAFAYLGDGSPRHVVVPTSPADSLQRRLRTLSDAAYDACTTWAPGGVDMVIIEEPGFITGSIRSVFALGRAQGAIIAGLPAAQQVQIVDVNTWRRALDIKGGPGVKDRVVAYVREFGIDVPSKSLRSVIPDHDVADAYAIASYGLSLTHQLV